MWFKNIQLFRFTENFTLSAQQLHDKLSQDRARDCGKLERMTLGWVSPVSEEEDHLVFGQEGKFLIAMRQQVKLLPATVVREQVKVKALQLEKELGRQLGSKERKQLFDELSITMLAQAFSKNSTIYAYIDVDLGCLIINTSSRVKAEELTVLLRKSLGSLKLLNPEVKEEVAPSMSQWLQFPILPGEFMLESSCELQDKNNTQCVIKCVNQDLSSPEVLSHLKAGKQVMKLALTWQDRLSFVLEKDFALKRIRFLDLVQEQRKDIETETDIEKLAADFAIFSFEFAQFIPAVCKLFGGFKSIEETTPVKTQDKAYA